MRMVQQVITQLPLWLAVCQSHCLSHSAECHTDSDIQAFAVHSCYQPRAPLAQDASERSTERGWGHCFMSEPRCNTTTAAGSPSLYQATVHLREGNGGV